MSNINLIPVELIKEQRSLFSKRKIAIFCSLIFIILIIALIIYWFNSMTSELKEIELQKKELNPQLAEVSEMRSNLEEMKKELEALAGISRSSWGKKLLEINSKIPDGVRIKNIKADKENLLLQGYCQELFLVGLTVSKFNELDFIKSVDLKSAESININDQKYYSFTILCRVK